MGEHSNADAPIALCSKCAKQSTCSEVFVIHLAKTWNFIDMASTIACFASVFTTSCAVEVVKVLCLAKSD